MANSPTSVKPQLTDNCPDCPGRTFADCVHRDARLAVIAAWTPPVNAPNGGPTASSTPQPKLKSRADCYYCQRRAPGECPIHDVKPAPQTPMFEEEKPAPRAAKPEAQLDDQNSYIANGVRYPLTASDSPAAIEEHLAKTARLPEEARQHPERGLTDEEQKLFRQRFGPRGLPGPSQVPPALINLKRWCGWKKVWDEDLKKWRKPPYSPVTGEAIGPSEKWSSHYVDFETARAGVKKHKLDGVGFLFTESDDYLGIDFDDCVTTEAIEDHSVSVIQEEVKNWLRWFSPSYQEYSPSGTGIHVLCRGKIAKAVKATLPNAGGATTEIYQQGRYFTFTGRRIGVTLEVNDCQHGIEKLVTHLTGKTPTASAPVTEKPHAMTIAMARHLHQENLKSFRAMKLPTDPQNDALNSCAFFAARAFAAGALKETAEQLQDELRQIAVDSKYCPGIEETLRSGWQNGITKPLAITTACTDLGNAERFVLHNGTIVKYVKAYGEKMGWYVWDGHRWKTDGTELVRKLAHDTVRTILQEAATTENDDDRKRLVAWALKSEGSHSITSLLNEVRPYQAVEPRELDSDPELLNLENGTLDLRTGEVRDQRPADLITRMLPVRYEPNASCPHFEKHLSLVLPDPEVRAYFQEMIAYHFSGSTGEQCIHILWGDGENGKSTTVDLFRNLAGDYGWPAPRALFAGGYQDIAPHQIADLLGRRFVTCSEFKNGNVLRVEVMKALTSGESAELNGARKYGHAFKFRPQAKFILDSNYLLEVDSPDLGTWRRIRLIAFNQTISQKVKKDIHFDKKLWAERSGLLNWIITGLKRWNARDRKLLVPEAITKESRRYEKEQDLLEQFIAAQCDRNPKAEIEISRFTGHYQGWLKERGSFNGNNVAGKRALKERLTKKGYVIGYDSRERCEKVQGLAFRELFGDGVI